MADSIRQIRSVFMNDWDPIAVGDDLPDDEYDAYASRRFWTTFGS